MAGALAALRFGRDDDPRLVHRLDRDTSGVLLLARTGAAAVTLARAFRSRAVEKLYLALVAGRPKPAFGTVHYALVKGRGPGGGERMKIVHPDEAATVEGAQSARTDYRVIDSAAGRASVVALRPVTGGPTSLAPIWPLLAPPSSATASMAGAGQENLGDGWGANLGQGISRKLHLHAWRLTLLHPVTGRPLTFSAPLPDPYARSWSLFGWDPEATPAAPFETEAAIPTCDRLHRPMRQKSGRGSLNSFGLAYEWIFALFAPLPGLALTG